MGRLRREKKKFHLKAIGTKIGNESDGVIGNQTEINPSFPLPSKPVIIFSEILKNLGFPAEDSDKRSVCKSAGDKEYRNRISKKSKMKFRREKFKTLKGLDSFYRDIMKKKKKLNEKKQSKVKSWDMTPLVSALPTSEELDEIKEKKIKTKIIKKRSTQKAQVRQKDWLENIEAFKSTLQDANIVIRNCDRQTKTLKQDAIRTVINK